MISLRFTKGHLDKGLFTETTDMYRTRLHPCSGVKQFQIQGPAQYQIVGVSGADDRECEL